MGDLFQLPPKLTPEQMVVELNRRLRSIALALEAMTRPPREAVNHGGQRITNVGRARADTDAVTRQDLLDHAVFALEGNAAVARRPLIAGGGIRVGKIARHKDEVVTLDQMGEHVDTMISTMAVLLGGPPASAPPPAYETFTGPATSVTLAIAPSLALVFKNGVQQHPVGGPPAAGQFNLSGTTLTLAIGAPDVVDVYEWA